jgi:hypothetical protein
MNRSAEDLGGARRWTHHPEQQADGSRLAGAVQAEKGVDLAPTDAQRKVIDGSGVAIALRQSPSRDRI